MPLSEMSVNIQQPDTAESKTGHDQFASTGNIKQEDVSAINGPLQDIPAVSITEHNIKRERSSSPTLSSGSEPSTSPRNSPSPDHIDLTPDTSPLAPGYKDSPSHPAASSPTSTPTALPPPPAIKLQSPTSMAPSTTPSTTAPKRKRKTAAEKEADERERAQKRAKREEELAVKAKEKEERDAVKAAKAAEKAKAAAEKEERARKQKEEEEKKKRKQPTLFGFLKKPVLGDVSPNKQSASKLPDSSPIRPKPVFNAASESVPPSKDVQAEKSPYERLFQSFFIKSDVTVAPEPFEMDSQTKLAKSKILDEYIRGERGAVDVKPFDPVQVFQFNGFPTVRGRQHPSVKRVMAEMFGDPLDNRSSRTESQQVRYTSVKDQLDAIPVKFLTFFEDVRPSYIGTLTSTPVTDLQKLARRPIGRLLKLNYDYDSEAEWEEEEGEDLDDEEVEDEENDNEGEMDGFIDDAEDVAAARPGFTSEMEPVSTGVCYENRKRLSHKADGETCATVYKYRMEFLLESLEHHHSIDPFSQEYWQPKVTKATMDGPAQSKLPFSNAAKSGMAPPPPPSTLNNTVTSSALAEVDPDTLVPKEDLKNFKKAIVSSDIDFLTKAGIVEMLSKRFPAATKTQVKTTLDLMAERISLPGEKESAKRWVLRPEHALNKD